MSNQNTLPVMYHQGGRYLDIHVENCSSWPEIISQNGNTVILQDPFTKKRYEYDLQKREGKEYIS